MNKAKEKLWLSIAVVFAVCITIYTLSSIVTQPSHILPTLGGDGVKNSFTYLYQCVYGKGFWFDGMNYPYGEHITYTDGQPLLSVLLSSFGNVTANQALTVLWLFIGLSYVLSVIYIYLTLAHYRVKPPIAIIFAGLITVFSPQIFRLEAHYALSYMCIVPMLFYWTMQYHERSLWRYCVYIFVLGSLVSFLHPYFAALILVWVLSYITGYLIFTKAAWKNKIKHGIPMLAGIMSVFAFVAVVMAITDPVTDRPRNPFGILSYVTETKDILSSIYSPIWIYMKENKIFEDITKHVSDVQEGYVYLGVVIVVVVIFSFVKHIVDRIRKNSSGTIVSKEGFSPVWLFMAFGTLLFSMGVPYIWHMEWLLDYMSFLKQFRTLGRFSWIFYYIISIYTVIVIYTYYARLIARRRFVAGYAILVLSIAVWGYEASGYTKYTRGVAENALHNYDSFFSTKEQGWGAWLLEHHVAAKDFQSILMVNFFHIGSEKLWVGDAGLRITISAKASYQLHLPIVNVMMSRSSLSQTMKQVKIAAGPYAEKPILNDMKSHKPFLLLHFEEDSLDADQKYLLEAADYIGRYSQCNIYALYPDRFTVLYKKNMDSISSIVPFISAQDTCVVYQGHWVVDHMDNLHANDRFFGSGASPVKPDTDSIIATIPVKPLKDNQVYEFSCWFLLDNKDYRSPCIYFEVLDDAGNVIGTPDLNTKWSVDNNDMWFRASVYLRLSTNCRTLRCKLGKDDHPAYHALDEIMLRPSDALIISKAADGSVMVNNHLFKKVK